MRTQPTDVGCGRRWSMDSIRMIHDVLPSALVCFDFLHSESALFSFN